MPNSSSPLSSSGTKVLGPACACTLAMIGVTLLATAANPEPKENAPVPAGLVPMATLRARSLPLFTTGPQSTLALALVISEACATNSKATTFKATNFAQHSLSTITPILLYSITPFLPIRISPWFARHAWPSKPLPLCKTSPRPDGTES